MPLWNAWAMLMDGRDVSSGEALSWLEVSRYCEDHDISGEERRRWCRLLKAMDRVYVQEINARATDGERARPDDRRDGHGARRAASAAGA
jgi:hypothetical protein